MQLGAGDGIKGDVDAGQGENKANHERAEKGAQERHPAARREEENAYNEKKRCILRKE